MENNLDVLSYVIQYIRQNNRKCNLSPMYLVAALQGSGGDGWQFTGAFGDSNIPSLSDSNKYRPGGKSRTKQQPWPLKPHWFLKS